MSYDPRRAAAFYDDYAEREWTRFEDGRTSPVSLEIHAHYLRRFVEPGDRVLDVGAGPGRFTIALARLGATIVVADLSPVQLELNREKVAEAGREDAVLDRVLADVVDLPFEDGSFDRVVCFGGALSYVLDRAEQAAAELARVTRPGGHLLVSVMSLVGSFAQGLRTVLALPLATNEPIIASGFLPAEVSGHLDMRLYRWRELEALLGPHGQIVAASASDLNGRIENDLFATLDDDTCAALVRWEVELAAEPGARDAGAHIIAVVRRPG